MIYDSCVPQSSAWHYFCSTKMARGHFSFAKRISFHTFGVEIIVEMEKNDIWCFAQRIYVILMVQVEGPSYKLILKKEKAHDMDINCVRWCPQVITENGQQIISIYLAGK